MTKTEMNRFRAILTAKVAELERFTRHREGITVERSADQRKRSRRLHNAHSRLVTSTVNLTNFETPVRPSVGSKKAASGHARSVMTTSPRSGFRRCRGLNSVYGARKP